jgi:hypothetical protein
MKGRSLNVERVFFSGESPPIIDNPTSSGSTDFTPSLGKAMCNAMQMRAVHKMRFTVTAYECLHFVSMKMLGTMNACHGKHGTSDA